MKGQSIVITPVRMMFLKQLNEAPGLQLKCGFNRYNISNLTFDAYGSYNTD